VSRVASSLPPSPRVSRVASCVWRTGDTFQATHSQTLASYNFYVQSPCNDFEEYTFSFSFGLAIRCPRSSTSCCVCVRARVCVCVCVCVCVRA
jgi:hypothetical protein